MVPNNERGNYIILDGISGSGKDTQVDLLKHYVDKNALDCIFVQEPTANPIGALLKATNLKSSDVAFDDRTKAHLFAADRAYLLSTVIEPNLAKGTNVISNRGLTSTFASQTSGDLSYQDIKEINSFMPDPSLILIYDIPPYLASERLSSRNEAMNRDESNIQKQIIARNNYLKLSEYYDNVVVLDTVKIGFRHTKEDSIGALFNKTLSHLNPILTKNKYL
ncbi:MAG: dTMP kinase [DPANN group archaeon]|nr:dTMP kinase [DPANN group archaeon]